MSLNEVLTRRVPVILIDKVTYPVESIIFQRLHRNDLETARVISNAVSRISPGLVLSNIRDR